MKNSFHAIYNTLEAGTDFKKQEKKGEEKENKEEEEELNL